MTGYEFGLVDHVATARVNVLRELIQLSLDRADLVSLSGGLPAQELFDMDGLRMASEAVFRANSRSAFQYNQTEGMPELRERILPLLAQRGIAADANNLLITSGAQQANDLITRCFVSPGDVVLVERPTFITALQTFRAAQAHLHGIEHDAEGPSVDAVLSALKEHRAAGRRVKLFYIVPTYSNPAGRVTTEKRRRELIEVAAREGLMILEDDPYSELWFDAPPPKPMRALANEEETKRILYVSSLSKTISPGMRLGWILLPSELVGSFRFMKSTADVHSSVFAQAVAANYLGLGRLDDRVAVARKLYASRAKALCDGLDRHAGAAFQYERPQGGMFVWGRIADQRDAADFAKRALRDHGVAVVPGDPFFETAPEPGWLRFAFSQSDEATITRGVERFGEALKA